MIEAVALSGSEEPPKPSGVRRSCAGRVFDWSIFMLDLSRART